MSNDRRRDTWDGREILRKAQSNGYGPDTDRDGDDRRTDVAGLTKKTTLGGGSNMEDDPDNDTSSANSINHRSSEYIANKPDAKQQRHSVLAMPSDFAFKSLVHKQPTPQELFNPENQQLDTKKAIQEIDLENHSKSSSGSSSLEEDCEIYDQGPTDEEKNKALNKFFASKTLLIGRLAEKKKQAVLHITKKTSSLFLNLGSIRDNMLLEESHLIDRLAKEGLLAELDMLDRIETNQVNVYSAIVRHRIRIINQGHDFYENRYGPKAFDVVSVCFSLMGRSSTALGFEDEKLQLMISTLSLVLRCLEFGLFDISKLKEMLLCLFQKTEFINKQEEYITKHSNEFKIETFYKLMQCKSLCTGVLLQIVTALNDDWLYYYTQRGEVDYLQTRKDKRHILNKKGPYPENDHNPFVCDIRSYSLFSFIMFNYLLKELRKDGVLFSDDLYLKCMKDLVLYVYDFREDPLVLTIELVKPEYLSYYIGLNIEADHINRANEILKLISDLKKKFTEGTAIEKDDHDRIEQLEQDIGNIFGMLEILMGLQDETYSIRLMLTEKKVPELLVELFVNMQETYIGGSGEELVIQGLKVLYQLCRGNYTGQALITKGRSWKNFKKLIKGSFSVFNILFLKQLFEDDPKYLHINQEFAIELIDLFYTSFDNFFGTFAQPKPIEGANDLVALYAFKSLINLFIKTSNISLSIRRSYNLPISSKLHSMVEKFAYPLFIENYLQIHQIYEPKLLNKNWKLEDGSFLVSLMMLSGNHIKCMLVDFAYSLIKLYNKSCENYFPSEFVDGMEKSLPLDLSCFDYLMSFTEGIKFKTEIMSSYCIFRIFSQSSKIPAAYTLSELSVDGADTNVDLLPNSHLNQLPDMITSELNKFQGIDNQKRKFLKEDMFDYLLRGLCQMCYKYATGITWYFLASEKEEVKVNLTHKLHAMSEAVSVTIDMVMNKEDRHAGGGQTSRSTNMLEKMTKDQQSGITNKLKDALANILISIEKMFLKGGPSYKNILKKYELNIGHDDISKLKIASSLLMCEASFLNSSKLKQKKSNQDDDVDVLKSNTEHAILIELISNYKIIKKKFLQDNKTNKFYEVLQSKMENTNQTNLISYVCHSLGSLDHSTCEYNSLWFSKTHINTIIFLNNTMYWCPKTRIKLFEYLQKNPDVQQRLIGVIYKGLRDCFSILAYGPFFNDQWEIIFSKFYIFSSFIKGLCKQNCQEFKLFLGEFIPDLHCRNYSDQNTSVLSDLVNVQLKFLNFSGISFNKDVHEYPSDRLSTILLTDQLMRCIIDMLTGPCKPNQKSIYVRGNVIWLNVFSRVIEELDSNYYVLMNNMMEYLLSLIEGNNSEILRSFATTFDIPVLYSIMIKLLTMLWRRVTKKRQKDTLNKARKLKKDKNKVNPISGKDGILGSSKSSVRSSDFLKDLEDNKEFQEIDSKKIDNWSDLISMYMNGDFKNHPALACSIKIFIFLSRVSYKSKKYQIFFDIKEAALTAQFKQANFKEEEIRLNQCSLKGKTQASEDVIVYYFMKNITSRVEIKEANLQSEIVIFPKPPMCFFLREATMITFTETCNIENTEAKLIDMFESFEQFYLEMQSHQQFKSTYRIIGKFATDKVFKWLRVICYMISVMINVALLYDVEFQDGVVIQGESTDIVLALTVILDLLALVSVSLWLMANFKVAWIESYKKFQVKHPFRNAFAPNNLIMILYEIFVRKDIINFILHFFIATIGVSYSILIQVEYSNSSVSI